jgi:large subunit ribosomal protein L15
VGSNPTSRTTLPLLQSSPANADHDSGKRLISPAPQPSQSRLLEKQPETRPVVATRRRRTRRLRGSRTHGWGRSGQHRGSGQQGGHGNAGWKRHKWSAVIRYGIQIREIGFKSVNQHQSRIINLGDLDTRLESLISQGYAKETNGRMEVDLAKAGYAKLLGTGGVRRPIRVIVNEYSEKAKEKISQSGGEIIVPGKTKGD